MVSLGGNAGAAEGNSKTRAGGWGTTLLNTVLYLEEFDFQLAIGNRIAAAKQIGRDESQLNCLAESRRRRGASQITAANRFSG
jgi:hypothetical protein